ncbi:MAG: class I SAM-dependent methyltransferase [Terriglobia bacterium]
MNRPQRDDKATLLLDIVVFSSSGELVAEVEGFGLRQAGREAVSGAGRGEEGEWLYEVKWKAEALEGGKGVGGGASLEEIAEVLKKVVEHGRSERGLGEFASLFPRLEALSTQYVVRAFRQLGWEMKVGERIRLGTKAEEWGVLERHRRLLGRMLEILEQDGYLKREEETWEVRRIPEGWEPAEELSKLMEQYPGSAVELEMTGRCGQRFAEALRGECDPLELLFPEGSLADAEKLYRDSPFFEFYNRLIEEAIRSAITAIPPTQKISILEIGAGTGGTTTYVLPRVPADRTEYVFTDVSPLFLSKARERFGGHGFVQYRVLDIERDPVAQGFEANTFDIIVASNVLHATADLRQTLKRVSDLLAPGGFLILFEETVPMRFTDLIVGLTEGWWKFRDEELRRSHALISGEKWKEVLRESGFGEVLVIPEGEGEGSILGKQSVILARG